jgi:cytochrome c biogenesis protein CcmG/thiol:disulfide interchange protein DsbE
MPHCKKWSFLLGCLATISLVQAQTGLSTAMLKPARGTAAAYSTFTQKDSLILICFWSINSDESINELNAINTKYDDWKQNVKFKMMAVSVDEGKLSNRVRPTAIMNGWTFEVYDDFNGDLRKALNSNNFPQSFIIKNRRIVYQQSGYEAGTENYLFQKLTAASNSK